MDVHHIRVLTFSPCGSAEQMGGQVARKLGDCLHCPVMETAEDSCTRPAERKTGRTYSEGELLVMGVPVYAGKVPNKLLPWLRSSLHGNGALAVPLVLFGNRSYDNALAELCAVLESAGFHTVAAAAFVSRHVFSHRIAAGRPGPEDIRAAETFAIGVGQKIEQLEDIPLPICVPGRADAPYYVPRKENGEPAAFLKAKPKTRPGACNGCGLCVRLCPMGAIDRTVPERVPGTCIKCQACVRSCPRQAKYFDDPDFLSHVAMLERDFQRPAENAWFL